MIWPISSHFLQNRNTQSDGSMCQGKEEVVSMGKILMYTITRWFERHNTNKIYGVFKKNIKWRKVIIRAVVVVFVLISSSDSRCNSLWQQNCSHSSCSDFLFLYVRQIVPWRNSSKKYGCPVSTINKCTWQKCFKKEKKKKQFIQRTDKKKMTISSKTRMIL